MDRLLNEPMVDTLAATGDRWNLSENPSLESGKYDDWFWQGSYLAGTGVVSGGGEPGVETVFGDYALAAQCQAQYVDENVYLFTQSADFADQEWLTDLKNAGSFTFSVYVKPEITDGDPADEFSLTAYTRLVNGDPYAQKVVTVPFGEWSRVWVSCDIAAGANMGIRMLGGLQPNRAFPDGVKKVRLLIDGALLEPGPDPLPYFDGSFEGAEWLGTPNLSTSKAAKPYTPFITVTPDEANHRALILVSGRAANKVYVWREVNGGLPQPVRGIDGITLKTDEQLFFDYEIPQGDNITYIAKFVDTDGTETLTAPVFITPQNYGGDIVFPLNDPINALKIHVEAIDQLNWGVSQNIVKVWNRMDPIVVTGVRELPSSKMTFVTFTARDRQTFLKMLRDGGVVGFNPAKSDSGFDGIAYFSVGQVNEARLVPRASDPIRRWTVTVQQVDAPPATWPYPAGFGETWGELERTDDDWALVADELWVDVLDFGGEELMEDDPSQ